jgi:uncharacterized membrane protein YdfJ with MMPL/SSD domain
MPAIVVLLKKWNWWPGSPRAKAKAKKEDDEISEEE